MNLYDRDQEFGKWCTRSFYLYCHNNSRQTVRGHLSLAKTKGQNYLKKSPLIDSLTGIKIDNNPGLA